MWAARKRLARLYRALDAAEDYDAWLRAARDVDAETGASGWREQDASPHYDATALRRGIKQMRGLRSAGDGRRLAGMLTDHLYRHLNDLYEPSLYDRALGGTKLVVEDYLDEAEASLRWLASAQVPGVSRTETLARFEAAWKVFGRSALLLSGGATLGFFHLGVVKALFELGILPHILSGSSTGAMVAAGVGTRTEAELVDMYADPDQIRLDGLALVGLRSTLRTGTLLDPTQLDAVLRHNVGTATFAEAYARSGRTLNISVSPTRTRQKPRLLTHLTAPDVLVASAALASSALPGLFPPVVLKARSPDGAEVDFAESERWVDGSLFGDLPKQRLSRLHNVNHFIVSQTNPHVLPFARHYGGLGGAVGGLASATIRSQGALVADIARRASSAAGGARHLADRAYHLVSQDYRGDIDIHPQLSTGLYRKVVRNPTREDLAAFIRGGERSVWPRAAMIRDQTRIGRTFRDCVRTLQAELRSA